jgi:heat shock protein HspQ
MKSDRKPLKAQAPRLAKHPAARLAAASARAYIEAMTQPDELPLERTTALNAPPVSTARFTIGEVVRHRLFDFRGVIFDVDPVFANSEEWYQAIPEEIRPAKDQPYYHLLAENAESSYIAYVSQQNLLADTDGEPVDHPAISGMFEDFDQGRYRLRRERRH